MLQPVPTNPPLQARRITHVGLLWKAQGLTLVELMVAMAISSIVLGSVVSFHAAQTQAFTVQGDLTAMQRNVHAAANAVANLLRQAGYNPTNAVAVQGFANISATSLQRFADLDSDGVVVGQSGNQDVTITFDAVGKTLNIIRPPSSIVSFPDIDNVTFTYLDQNGAATTTLSNIRIVQVVIMGRTAIADPHYTHPTSQDGYRRFVLTTRITPLNMAL